MDSSRSQQLFGLGREFADGTGGHVRDTPTWREELSEWVE